MGWRQGFKKPPLKKKIHGCITEERSKAFCLALRLLSRPTAGNRRGTTNAGGLEQRENFSAPGSTLSQIPWGTWRLPPFMDKVGNLPRESVLFREWRTHSPYPGFLLKEFREAAGSPTLGTSQREGRRHQGFPLYTHFHPASASIPPPSGFPRSECSGPLTL